MRTFVLKDTFDVENFELQTAELHEALKQISAWVHKVTPPNELSASVRFAHHILTIMTNYLPAFKHYGACSLSHSGWVYKMMHFNLCLLLLCDYQGGINKKDSWYSERVFKAWVRLYLWKRKLKNQTDVPGDVKYLYETEITKAEQGIAFLTSQLPDMEPWDDSEFLLLSRIE
ncbi:hypothetical protein JCM33374_g2431 [Metschnikowia sp. JCM 33374]|nr:hypothetical protein JCM33374_g2431 [Metschnikowia sp. JCM 33374]